MLSEPFFLSDTSVDVSTAVDDDRLLFADESPEDPSEAAAGDGQTWKIMLVDDEPAIHQATKVALRFFKFEARSLSFISAYSEAEAKQLIEQHPDTVLVLLDVIMKTQDAGLKVAKYIREDLKNRQVRIVLRTGQSGQVPEADVVLNYDINDYKTKLELTQEKLFTTLVSSIRAYRDLVALEDSKAALSQANLALETFNQNLEARIRDRTRLLAHEIEERTKAEDALKLYIHALTHDLRNPVTGMITVLQTLLERQPQADRREDTAAIIEGMPENDPKIEISASMLSRMKSGCDRQLKMISMLLETHEIELRGVSLQRQSFDIQPLIAALVEEWQLRFERKRVKMTVAIAPDIPALDGDSTQLWRVFENLIDNALKYNPPGIVLTLAVSRCDTNPGYVLCSLQDNGVGISMQQIERLFQLYQRGPHQSPTSGLGLGLYVCRRIVEAHGGQISVSSQPNAGSQFRFTLPIAADDQ